MSSIVKHTIISTKHDAYELLKGRFIGKLYETCTVEAIIIIMSFEDQLLADYTIEYFESNQFFDRRYIYYFYNSQNVKDEVQQSVLDYYIETQQHEELNLLQNRLDEVRNNLSSFYKTSNMTPRDLYRNPTHSAYSYVIQRRILIREMNNYIKSHFESTLNSLTLFIQQLLDIYDPHAECSICLDNIHHLDYVKTECEHTYHIHCLTKWMKINQNCPLCRSTVIEVI